MTTLPDITERIWLEDMSASDTTERTKLDDYIISSTKAFPEVFGMRSRLWNCFTVYKHTLNL